MQLVSGCFEGEAGVFNSLTDAHLMLVQLQAGAEVALPAPRGEAMGGGQLLPAQHLIELNDDFVMSTEQEILEAWRDYRSGRFGSLRVG